MEIVIGWAITALYLVVAYLCMGSEFAWFMGMLIAWAEGRELFGEQGFGQIILVAALTITGALYIRNFVRWVHRRRSPLLIGQRSTDATTSAGQIGHPRL